MEHALNHFNTTYFLTRATRRLKRNLYLSSKDLEEQKKKVERLEESCQLREAVVEKQKVDIALTTGELERAREHLKKAFEKVQSEGRIARALADNAVKDKLTEQTNEICALKTALAKENSVVEAMVSRRSSDSLVIAAQANEIELLKSQLANPEILQGLYAEIDEHSREMAHFIQEGFLMAKAHIVKHNLKNDKSKEEIIEEIINLDYTTAVEILGDEADDS